MTVSEVHGSVRGGTILDGTATVFLVPVVSSVSGDSSLNEVRSSVTRFKGVTQTAEVVHELVKATRGKDIEDQLSIYSIGQVKGLIGRPKEVVPDGVGLEHLVSDGDAQKLDLRNLRDGMKGRIGLLTKGYRPKDLLSLTILLANSSSGNLGDYGSLARIISRTVLHLKTVYPSVKGGKVCEQGSENLGLVPIRDREDRVGVLV